MWDRTTVCRNGHPRTPEETLGGGACRICHRVTVSAYKARVAARNAEERGWTMGAKPTCPQGHPREARRPGRYDCSLCHRQRQLERLRAKGVPARKPGMTPDEYRLARRKWQAKRKALMLAAFVEDVEPAEVLRRGNGRCGICTLPIAGKFEVDHKRPLARGGEHSYANVQPAHPPCNRRKWASYSEPA